MAAFPSYACILLAGYGEEPDYGVIRTPMDGGLAKQYSRWSEPIVTRDVSIRVRGDANKALFDEWVKTELFGGSGWFSLVIPRTGVTKQARIVSGKYKWGEPSGIVWTAPCQIETLG